MEHQSLTLAPDQTRPISWVEEEGDSYTGETVTDATRVEIDHMIPFKNAHDSGGWAWDKTRKAAFANEKSCTFPTGGGEGTGKAMRKLFK